MILNGKHRLPLLRFLRALMTIVSSSLNPFRKEWVNTPKRKLTHKKASIVFFYLNYDPIRGRITGARSREDFDTRIGSRLKIKTFLKKFSNEMFEDDI